MVLGLDNLRWFSTQQQESKIQQSVNGSGLHLEDGLADRAEGLSSVNGRQPPSYMMSFEVGELEARPPYLHVSFSQRRLACPHMPSC